MRCPRNPFLTTTRVKGHDDVIHCSSAKPGSSVLVLFLPGLATLLYWRQVTSTLPVSRGEKYTQSRLENSLSLSPSFFLYLSFRQFLKYGDHGKREGGGQG